MSKMVEMTGKVFGRLTVLKRTGKKHGQALWLCRCICGNLLEVEGYCLRSGNTRSCGCLQREEFSKRRLKHGQTGSRLYYIWGNMKKRCLNPKNPNYFRYGGRGIYIYPEWLTFEKFSQWAESTGYHESLELDRIDNDGPYTPENCRWATREQQVNNTRRNIYYEYQGKTLTASQWAKEIGMDRNTLRQRLQRYGWSIERALTTPVS